MVHSVKINCDNTAYVSKSHSDTNFSNDSSLIVSLLKGQEPKINTNISLLAFPQLNLEFNNTGHAYLYLFLEDIKTVKNEYAKLNIIGDFSNIPMENVSWNNFLSNNLSNKIQVDISVAQINSYIKIDVTDIITSLAKFNIHYNLLICPAKSSTNIFVKFSSCNSNNPPYLILEKFKDDYEITNDINHEYSRNSNINIDFDYDSSDLPMHDNNFNEIMDKMDSVYNVLTNSITTINEKLSILDNQFINYSNIVNELSSAVSNLDNEIKIINNSIFSSKYIIQDLSSIIKDINDKIDNLDIKELNRNNTLENSFSSPANLISDLSSILKNLNNKPNNFKKDVKSSDEKLSKLFDVVSSSSPIFDFIKSEDSFQELSNTLLDAISKNISLLNKEIDTSNDEE